MVPDFTYCDVIPKEQALIVCNIFYSNAYRNYVQSYILFLKLFLYLSDKPAGSSMGSNLFKLSHVGSLFATLSYRYLLFLFMELFKDLQPANDLPIWGL